MMYRHAHRGLVVAALRPNRPHPSALVGGRTGQFISNAIAYHMQQSLNWGLAAALGCVLLVCVLAMYWLYSRFIGIDNMKMG